jgi:GT2 family glycosyltransferase
LTNYYSHIKILNPTPKPEDTNQPGYVVTANCLINSIAFAKAEGFDENFELAGGEDVDLGIRLSYLGKLKYAPDAVMQHEFENSIRDFFKRFLRYGKGMKRVIEKHKLSLTIEKMMPEVNMLKFMPLKLLMVYAFRKGHK